MGRRGLLNSVTEPVNNVCYAITYMILRGRLSRAGVLRRFSLE